MADSFAVGRVGVLHWRCTDPRRSRIATKHQRLLSKERKERAILLRLSEYRRLMSRKWPCGAMAHIAFFAWVAYLALG